MTRVQVMIKQFVKVMVRGQEMNVLSADGQLRVCTCSFDRKLRVFTFGNFLNVCGNLISSQVPGVCPENAECFSARGLSVGQDRSIDRVVTSVDHIPRGLFIHLLIRRFRIEEQIQIETRCQLPRLQLLLRQNGRIQGHHDAAAFRLAALGRNAVDFPGGGVQRGAEASRHTNGLELAAHFGRAGCHLAETDTTPLSKTKNASDNVKNT